MKTTIVPPNPGNLSAFGLLAVDWRTDHMVTKVMHEEAIDLAAVAAIYGRSKRTALRRLDKDGIAPTKSRSLREADVRYAGQSMEVRVPAPAGEIDAQFVAGLVEAFHAAHLKTFGYNYAGQQKVEVVNFCVSAFGVIDRPEHPALDEIRRGAEARAAGRFISTANFATRRFSRAPRCRRDLRSTGPAIVEEFGSTTVVFPGQKLTVDPHGILIVRAGGDK